MRMSIEESKVRARMRTIDDRLHRAVRERDWGEAAEQDGLLKKCEEEIYEIRRKQRDAERKTTP